MFIKLNQLSHIAKQVAEVIAMDSAIYAELYPHNQTQQCERLTTSKSVRCNAEATVMHNREARMAQLLARDKPNVVGINAANKCRRTRESGHSVILTGTLSCHLW